MPLFWHIIWLINKFAVLFYFKVKDFNYRFPICIRRNSGSFTLINFNPFIFKYWVISILFISKRNIIKMRIFKNMPWDMIFWCLRAFKLILKKKFYLVININAFEWKNNLMIKSSKKSTLNPLKLIIFKS